MHPVICSPTSKMIINACVIFMTGLLLIVLPILLPALHTYNNTLFHWIGGTLLFISLVGLLTLKKIILDANGITVEYYIGKTTHYRFDQIVDITAKMNMPAISLYAKMAGHRRHTLILQPGGGKMKLILTSSSVNQFMDLFNALQQIYGNRMTIINSGN